MLRGARHNKMPDLISRANSALPGTVLRLISNMADASAAGSGASILACWRSGKQHDTVAATDLLISLVSANVLEDSQVGFIFTDGDPTSNLENRVVGADFQTSTTGCRMAAASSAQSFFSKLIHPGWPGMTPLWIWHWLSRERGVRGRIGYKVVEENFNPAMGFVNNAGIGDFTADFGYTHFFSAGIFQTAFAGVDLQRIDLLDGGLQTEVVNYRLLELESTQRDRFQLAYITNEEVVLDRFPIYWRPGEEVHIEAGVYQFNEQSVNFQTAGQRRLSGSLTYRSGDFFNGDRLNLSGRVTWNQSRYFNLSASYDWNDIQLPQGSFTTRLSSINSQVAFSPTLYWITLAQYDNISEEIGINTRLQWIPRAGQEGFIVLNYGLEDRDRTTVSRPHHLI